MDVEDVSSSKKTLKIEIPPEDVNEELEKAFEEIRTTASVPGFRKGHAPRRVLQMRFDEYVKGQVIEKLVPPAFDKAVKEANLEILRPLDPDDMKPPIKELSVERDVPLVFEITIDVKPEIIIPDLTQLKVEKGDVDVKKEDVDAVLNQQREERASFVPVEDRPVQEGDYVTLSYVATSNDEILEDQEEQVFQVRPDILVSELVQHLVGMQPEEKKEVLITLPEDHQAKHLAGKEVSFRLNLHKVTEKHLPALDDDFAKDLGEEDMEHLTSKIWNQFVEMRRQQLRAKQGDDLVAQLLEKSQFEVPEFVVEEQVKALIRSYRQQQQPQQTELSEEQLSQYRSLALNMIKRSWVFSEIARREEISVTDEDLEAEVRVMAEMNKRDPQKYMKLLEGAKRLDGIRAALWERKIMDLLFERASPKQDLIV